MVVPSPRIKGVWGRVVKKVFAFSRKRVRLFRLIHPRHPGIVRKQLQQFRYTSGLAWQHEIGEDFGQGLQDEAAQVGARVREGQRGGTSSLSAECNQVEVERARFIGHTGSV